VKIGSGVQQIITILEERTVAITEAQNVSSHTVAGSNTNTKSSINLVNKMLRLQNVNNC
jgi:hypothetical protein